MTPTAKLAVGPCPQAARGRLFYWPRYWPRWSNKGGVINGISDRLSRWGDRRRTPARHQPRLRPPPWHVVPLRHRDRECVRLLGDGIAGRLFCVSRRALPALAIVSDDRD